VEPVSNVSDEEIVWLLSWKFILDRFVQEEDPDANTDGDTDSSHQSVDDAHVVSDANQNHSDDEGESSEQESSSIWFHDPVESGVVHSSVSEGDQNVRDESLPLISLENSVESFLTEWQDDDVSNTESNSVNDIPTVSEIWEWKNHLVNSPWGEDTEADQQSSCDSGEHESESNSIKHLTAEVLGFLSDKPGPLEISDHLVIKPATERVANGSDSSDSSQSIVGPGQCEVHNSDWKE
jgi:hypothetical protein